MTARWRRCDLLFAINTVPDAGAYAASKGGTPAITRALAMEGAALSVDGGLLAAQPGGPPVSYKS